MNTPDHTSTLLDAALARLRRGDLAGAAEALEQAAGATTASPASRDAIDRARSLQLAASLRSALGQSEAARALADQAAAVLPGDVPTEIAALVRQAEADEAAGRWRDAARRYGMALDEARQTPIGADASVPPPSGTPPPSAPQSDATRLIALLRARAACLIADGAYAEAAADFDAACALATPPIAAFLRTEHARLLADAGAFDAARAALPPPDPNDAQLAAEIGVEHARLERAAGHWSAARLAAGAARARALEAVAPVPYFAASVELAEIHDALGERTDAYGSLATAWATLSDLLGADVARSWVEPCLLALRMRWGEAGFDQAKRAHDDRRRAQRGEAKR
ncbi:hypothetical protein [Burkholderia ubonensis]|uniref:hypothetical protein n=1 Tax=Burkholderia ubonensis TaxID=101571 RepID=UPI00075B7E64|nr:hypothetical protein [Burkholderia ubonensis]KVD68441.1 hypothetical protein WI88_32845 [Burkholderia ubonensis]